MAKRDIAKLSADELYKLAKQKEKEERQKQKEALRTQISELKQKRKELVAAHNKELAAIDTEISALTGKRGKRGRAGGTSAAILQALSSGQLDTKTIRAQLEAQGIPVGNLPQTMAYLKRTGRVVSTGRGIYKKAGKK